MRGKRNILATLLLCFFWGALLFGKNTVENLPPYKNPKLTLEERVNDLLSRMTIEEKAHQLASFFPNANVRLGIPHIQAGEALHGVCLPKSTSFPMAIALASTWDPDLIEEMANIIAKEARALGVHHVYSPMLGVARDPRWGRTEESYGEDPYLVSRIGVAFINGLQGTGEHRFDENHIIATAKHFIADGEPIAGLNGSAFDVSERTLHEVFLPPFKAAVEEAKVGSIMPAHHSLNDVPCHANKHIMNDILRDTYGFDGLVVSDNNDIFKLMHFMRVAKTWTEAARLSLEVGIDTELAWERSWDTGRAYGAPLVEGVKNGTIPIALLDKAVKNVLRAKFMLGLFDDGEDVVTWQDYEMSGDKGKTDYKEVTYAESIRGRDLGSDYFNQLDRLTNPRKNAEEILNDPAHNKMALEVARKAIILLKNDNNILPLNKARLKRIAVIGPNADEELLGGYSTPKVRYFVSVLDGIRNHVGDEVEVLYAEGVSLEDFGRENIDESVAIARKSDVAIVVIGGNEVTCKENEDRDDLGLVGKQQELVEAVYATGTPVVIVLLHGRPLAIEWIKNHVPAIIDGWYLGQETGNAVADVLFGEVNPGGKLPMTVPRNVGQVPNYYNMMRAGRPGRYFKSKAEPLWPFGHGLSYTTFEYSNLKVAPTSSTSALVSVDITNTGEREGDEVVQLYIHDEYSSVVRPIMELKRFKRITLKPGEKMTVNFTLEKDAFAFYDEKTEEWIVEPGDFNIMIRSSSADIRVSKMLLLK
ncbi:MAG: glycoside hydrolase family 3 N-terminal domain-containing protein [Acidobacteriota bacterium]|nr:glycoside hydrolase family 3 N-terminal domain-containing protein [Acidobacteriota bacterium]